MAEAVREEEGVGIGLDEVGRVAAEDAEVDEAGGDAFAGAQVEVAVFDTGAGFLDGGALDGVDELVEVALDAFEPGPGREGAGDVAGVAIDFRAGVDEDEVAASELPAGRGEVEDGAVGTGADDGPVGGAVGAAAEELGLEFDLEGALGDAGPRDAEREEVAGPAGVSRPAHRVEFGGVLRAAGFADLPGEAGGEVVIERGFEAVEWGQAVAGGAFGQVAVAEEGERLAAAGFEPGGEALDGLDRQPRRRFEPVDLRAVAGPDAVLERRQGDEELPAFGGVEGEDARGFGDAGEIAEFRVGVELVELVGAGDRQREAAGDEDGPAVERPRASDAAAAGAGGGSGVHAVECTGGVRGTAGRRL
ncbi:hypothetical protein O0235_00025 [Tepidiforma flava]|uniref:Uncharacterized protein n=1 Tax=Tepidiforma flava TaxID=3004094 RepID=A0ABY7M7Q7_9CHLR|nr:hypothetical protein [Tepidiforma flava]WBL36058.1 hypothetical protein O0235_00025 [Tepidiforma flava]